MRISGIYRTSKRYGQYSDAELFLLIGEDHKRSEDAFSELYSRHSNRLYAYCRCLCRQEDESNDVFQETFTRFYEAARANKPVRNIPAYLLKIARNLALNLKRDKKPTVSVEDESFAVYDTPHERSEMLQLIAAAMELLTDEYREAFYLREFSDLPYNEIAELTKTSSANVRIRVTRAREKIRNTLHPYIIELEK